MNSNLDQNNLLYYIKMINFKKNYKKNYYF